MRVKRHGEVRSSKAGHRPSVRKLIRLHRKHKESRVKLAYNAEARSWWMIQRAHGSKDVYELLFDCGPRPCFRTIMRKLAIGKIGSLTREELERWVENMDSAIDRDARVREASARAAWGEGSDRLYSLIGSESRVSFAGAKHVPEAKQPDQSRPQDRQ